MAINKVTEDLQAELSKIGEAFPSAVQGQKGKRRPGMPRPRAGWNGRRIGKAKTRSYWP